MIYKEKVIGTNTIYQGKILDLKVETVSLPDNKSSKREIVDHNGGVAIAALKDNGKIILVNQYRLAAQDNLIEVPAGKLEKNEDPNEACKREFLEETGYELKDFKRVLEFYPTSGYSTEKIHLYIGFVGDYIGQDLDENEYIDVSEVSIEEAIKMIDQGQIIDAKTIIGILMLSRKLEELDNELS